MNIIIGIDFGTTKSSVGAYIDGKPVIIPAKNGSNTIPSEIYVEGIGESEQIFVGWESQNKNNGYKVKSIKRMAGKSRLDKEKWWYRYPQYTFSYILSELKCMAEDYFNQDISDAVITIPIHFDLNQRRSILEAAQIARLNVKRLLNEPTAAALEYSRKNPSEETYFIVDVGGGTTDIAVVNYGESVFEVKQVEGDTNLGGIEYSNILYDWLLEKLNKKYAIKKEDIDKLSEGILENELERVKRELSDGDSSLYLPWLSINNVYLKDEIHITQSDFLKISETITSQIADLCWEAKRGYSFNHQEGQEITTYLLMGSAGKTYGLKERIIKEMEISKMRRIPLETSVARGAIIQTNTFSGDQDSILVLDVSQDAYGIGLSNNDFDLFVNKGEGIPLTKEKSFVTSKHGQTSIQINVYKGERAKTDKNKHIGTLELNNIPEAAAGEIDITVKFDIDCNMNIFVSARIKDSNHKIETRLRSVYGLADYQLKDFQKKVDLWKSKRKLRK